MRTIATLLTLLMASSAAGFLVHAQVEPSGEGETPGDPELRLALKTYLERRLRTDLGLTDEQAATVFPRLETMQKEQARARQERQSAMRQLRRLFDNGAADTELEDALARLDTIEDDQRAITKREMSEIEASLNVRQRVGLRFFLIQFREDVRGRMDQLRMRSGRGGRNGAPGRNRPPVER